MKKGLYISLIAACAMIAGSIQAKYRILNGTKDTLQIIFGDPDQQHRGRPFELKPGAFYDGSGIGPARMSVRRWGTGSSLISAFNKLDADAMYGKIARARRPESDIALWVIEPTWTGYTLNSNPQWVTDELEYSSEDDFSMN